MWQAVHSIHILLLYLSRRKYFFDVTPDEKTWCREIVLHTRYFLGQSAILLVYKVHQFHEIHTVEPDGKLVEFLFQEINVIRKKFFIVKGHRKVVEYYQVRKACP